MASKNRGLYGNYVVTVDGQQRPPTTGSKKKKIPKNAFYFYMQDFREYQETKRIFYKSQKDVADAAASSWAQLSAEERKPYQDAAKEAKEKDKADLHNKFTTEGRSYAEVKREEQEWKEKQEKMYHEIRSTVRSLRTQAALNNYPFHIIHVNYYCKTASGLYVPCELAIAEFTLLDGVKRVFHVLINPGELPLGYKYEAEKHSQETHRIPMPSDFQWKDVIQDYPKIFQCLHTFLRESKAEYKLPPLYTIEQQLESCENVLTMLCDSVNEDNLFRVYPAKEMFFELQHTCVDVFKPADDTATKFPYVSLAGRELEKDIFDFTKDIACEFHQLNDDALPFCSSSCVQRWSFLILDFCHKVTNMRLIPGKHVPAHVNTSNLNRLRAPPKQSKPDIPKLNTAMQRLDLGKQSRDQASGFERAATCAEVLRTPKQLSEAMSLLSPSDSDDEFPPLGS